MFEQRRLILLRHANQYLTWERGSRFLEERRHFVELAKDVGISLIEHLMGTWLS